MPELIKVYKTDYLMTTGNSTLDAGTAVITETQKGVAAGCVWVITWLCPLNEVCS